VANSPSGEPLIARFDRVLDVFGPAHPQLTFREVCAAMRLPPSTAHRILGDMTRAGWLESGPARTYRVGTRLWELASRAAPAEGLAAAAIPCMSDVHAVLRQHVHVGVVEGFDVLFAERIEASGSPVPLRSIVAGRLPLHRAATGLALLCQCPEAFVRDYHRALMGRAEDAVAVGLPTTPERLLADLAVFAQRGYAIQRERIDRGAGGVAVPLKVPRATGRPHWGSCCPSRTWPMRRCPRWCKRCGLRDTASPALSVRSDNRDRLSNGPHRADSVERNRSDPPHEASAYWGHGRAGHG